MFSAETPYLRLTRGIPPTSHRFAVTDRPKIVHHTFNSLEQKSFCFAHIRLRQQGKPDSSAGHGKRLMNERVQLRAAAKKLASNVQNFKKKARSAKGWRK
jgi:hypothetical protein